MSVPTPHLAAAVGEIADAVLLPGDPRRAELFARELLSDVVTYNTVRNMTGLTGAYGGRRVSVQATGIGMPSIGVYAGELFKFYGVRTAIRVGTCGSMQDFVALRDIVIGTAAHTDSAFNRNQVPGIDYAPCADFGLASIAAALCAERGVRHHVGTIFSTDRYYDSTDLDGARALLVAHGTLGVEMEAAALYSVAAAHRARALCMTTVTDGASNGSDMTAVERETQLLEMAEIAFDTVCAAA